MNRRQVFAVPLVVATVAMFWIVPEPPWKHLDDPAHWGVLGYVATLLIIVSLRWRGIRGNRRERDLYVFFLAGMPIIYLAGWLRFGSDAGWFWIEVAGGVVYWTLAWLGFRRSPWFLVVGIAAHALWDAWHYGVQNFIPNWYVVGCVVIDLALGIYILGLVKDGDFRDGRRGSLP